MKLNELPQNIQNELNADRDNWKGTIQQNGYKVIAFNKKGTRFFIATRHCIGWQDTNTGNSMPFGGGTYWKVRYGIMNWKKITSRNPIGEVEVKYIWVRGKTYSSITKTDGSILEIPAELSTKKEVMKILKQLDCRDFVNLQSIK